MPFAPDVHSEEHDEEQNENCQEYSEKSAASGMINTVIITPMRENMAGMDANIWKRTSC